MRTVLVVEDEGSLAASLARGLPARARDLRVLLAEDGAMALEVLAASPVDLLVTDLDMPRLDGFELIARLSDTRPTLPVIVLTAMPIPAASARLLDLQRVDLFAKPVDLAALASAIERRLASAQPGFIGGVSLTGFLQLLSLERKTCTLRVSLGARRAAFFLTRGDVVAVELDGKPGAEAQAYETFSWDEARLGVDPGPHGRARTIHASTGELLLEACRLLDERDLIRR